ncbi:MAG: hypothetical protein M1830_009797 [Pleopsidium flavum]|nr:MAG: hypothetical protein M1830_009797 [Pleopsidium flavum]
MIDITAIINLVVNALGTANTAVHSWTTYWWNHLIEAHCKEESESQIVILNLESQALMSQTVIKDLEMRLECLRAAE